MERRSSDLRARSRDFVIDALTSVGDEPSEESVERATDMLCREFEPVLGEGHGESEREE